MSMIARLKKYRIHIIGLVVVLIGLVSNPQFRSSFGVFELFIILLFCGLFIAYFRRPSPPIKRMLGEIQKTSPEFRPSVVISGEGESAFFLDEKMRAVAFFCPDGSGLFRYRDIISSEVVEDGNSVTTTSRTSQVVGAAVGDLLIGGMGLLIGGLTGKTRTNSNISSLAVKITVNDTRQARYSIEFLCSKKALSRLNKRVKDALESADETHALISALIRQADDEEKANIPAQNIKTEVVSKELAKVVHGSFADELIKLAKLKEQGHLTDVEFLELRTSLLAQHRANSS